jgi:hypothetical protein
LLIVHYGKDRLPSLRPDNDAAAFWIHVRSEITYTWDSLRTLRSSCRGLILNSDRFVQLLSCRPFQLYILITYKEHIYILITERRRRMVSIPASYSGSPGFISRLGDRLS